MKIFFFLIFTILINLIYSQSTFTPPTTISPLSWSDFKLQTSKMLKNFNEQNKEKIYNEIEEIWKISCEKVKNDKIDEVSLINFVESLNDVMPKATNVEAKNGIKFHLMVLVGQRNDCKN